MQSITERRYLDRSSWPSGSWDNEPDWDSGTSLVGLPWEMRRARQGHWCGYVGIPTDHPYRGFLGTETKVHGFINWAGELNSVGGIAVPPNRLWYGFDCGHLRDIQPANPPSHRHPDDVYRALEYVRGQCESLAHQIDAAALLCEAGYGGPRHLRGEEWSAPVWAVGIAQRFEISRAERFRELRHRAFSAADQRNT